MTRPAGIRWPHPPLRRAYINYTGIYMCWLIAALFYHLPSLDSLGINVRADVSLTIVVTLGSLMVR